MVVLKLSQRDDPWPAPVVHRAFVIHLVDVNISVVKACDFTGLLRRRDFDGVVFSRQTDAEA